MQTSVVTKAACSPAAGAITIGVGLGHPGHGLPRPAARAGGTDNAGYGAFRLTPTAWNTYAVRLVAAGEAGVLKWW